MRINCREFTMVAVVLVILLAVTVGCSTVPDLGDLENLSNSEELVEGDASEPDIEDIYIPVEERLAYHNDILDKINKVRKSVSYSPLIIDESLSNKCKEALKELNNKSSSVTVKDFDEFDTERMADYIIDELKLLSEARKQNARLGIHVAYKGTKAYVAAAIDTSDKDNMTEKERNGERFNGSSSTLTIVKQNVLEALKETYNKTNGTDGLDIYEDKELSEMLANEIGDRKTTDIIIVDGYSLLLNISDDVPTSKSMDSLKTWIGEASGISKALSEKGKILNIPERKVGVFTKYQDGKYWVAAIYVDYTTIEVPVQETSSEGAESEESATSSTSK